MKEVLYEHFFHSLISIGRSFFSFSFLFHFHLFALELKKYFLYLRDKAELLAKMDLQDRWDQPGPLGK